MSVMVILRLAVVMSLCERRVVRARTTASRDAAIRLARSAWVSGMSISMPLASGWPCWSASSRKEERQPLGDVEGSGVDPSAVGGAEPVDDPAQEVWGDSRMRVEESPEFFAGDDAAFDRFECGVAGGAGASVVVDRFEDAEQVTGTVDGQHGLAAVEVGRTATPGDKRGVSWTGMAGWLED